MRLKVLGAYGASDAEHNLTGYLIDDWLAVDAGTLTSKLSFAQQSRIQAVFITHPHADHIGGAAKLVIYVLLALWSVVCLLPMGWLVLTSIKLPADVDQGPFFLPFVDFTPSLAV